MSDIVERLAGVVGAEHVLIGAAVPEDHTHDECLTVAGVFPIAVVCPSTTAEVSEILQACDEQLVPVTARGSATGLSGACTPSPEGIVVSFERMTAILEIDLSNHTATVQPGVTLAAAE